MAKNKLVKSSRLEKDEKKSIIIGCIVSAVVVLATILAFFAIRKNGGSVSTENVVVDQFTQTLSEDGTVIVANQEELDNALLALSAENSTTTAISITSEEEQTIEIAEGDYSAISLTVDAPYTEIKNSATFGTVYIKQISANTWTEAGQNNYINISAVSAHIVVEQGATVAEIDNQGYGSTLAVEIYGTVESMTLEADQSIASVSIDGSLKTIYVFSATNLTLSGSTANDVVVSIESGATSTTLKTSVPVDVSDNATSIVQFLEGSENSKLSAYLNYVVTTVNNDSTDIVYVKDAEGNETELEAGGTITLGSEESTNESSQPVVESNNNSTPSSSGNTTNSATSTSSSASGSTSSSSTNKTSSSSSGTSTGTSSSSTNSSSGTVSNVTTKPSTSTSTDTVTKAEYTSMKETLSASIDSLKTQIKELQDAATKAKEEKEAEDIKREEEKEQAVSEAADKAAKETADRLTREFQKYMTNSLGANIVGARSETGGIVFRNQGILTENDIERLNAIGDHNLADSSAAEYLIIENKEIESEDVNTYLANNVIKEVGATFYYFDEEGYCIAILSTDTTYILYPGDKAVIERVNPGKADAKSYVVEITAGKKELISRSSVSPVLSVINDYSYRESEDSEPETIQVLEIDNLMSESDAVGRIGTIVFIKTDSADSADEKESKVVTGVARFDLNLEKQTDGKIIYQSNNKNKIYVKDIPQDTTDYILYVRGGKTVTLEENEDQEEEGGST